MTTCVVISIPGPNDKKSRVRVCAVSAELVRRDGTESVQSEEFLNHGDERQFYVHSGQRLLIEEIPNGN